MQLQVAKYCGISFTCIVIQLYVLNAKILVNGDMCNLVSLPYFLLWTDFRFLVHFQAPGNQITSCNKNVMNVSRTMSKYLLNHNKR